MDSRIQSTPPWTAGFSRHHRGQQDSVDTTVDSRIQSTRPWTARFSRHDCGQQDSVDTTVDSRIQSTPPWTAGFSRHHRGQQDSVDTTVDSRIQSTRPWTARFSRHDCGQQDSVSGSPSLQADASNTERRDSIFLTISSLRRQLSPRSMRKWSGCNRVQIKCDTSQALKGATRDFYQSPHCAVNCLQEVCSKKYDQVVRAQSCANQVRHIGHLSPATCRTPRGAKSLPGLKCVYF